MLGAAVRPDPFPPTQLLGHPPDPRTFRLQHSAYRYIATEIDMIHVRRAAEHDSPAFEVIVREGKGETRHHVTMSREMCERLTAGKHTPERYLEAAFRFLLDREPKESISRYFPEFEREMPEYLSQL